MILLIRKRTLLYTWLAVCMIGLSAIFLAGSRRAFTPTGAMGQGSRVQTVVLDPGHGGQDGGAVAGDGTEESRINLALSLQLERTGNHAAAEGVGPPQPGVIWQRHP